MKHITITAAILLALGSSAHAQDGRSQNDDGGRRAMPERLRAFDANQDGQLDQDERGAIREARAQKLEGRKQERQNDPRARGQNQGEGRQSPQARGQERGGRRPQARGQRRSGSRQGAFGQQQRGRRSLEAGGQRRGGANDALPSFAPTESVARKVANVGASSDVVRINSAAAFAAKVSRSAGNVAAANCAAASCAESRYAAASFEDNSCAASRNAVDSSFAARG